MSKYKQIKNTHHVTTLGAWWIDCKDKQTGTEMLISRYPVKLNILGWFEQRSLGLYLRKFLYKTKTGSCVLAFTEQDGHVVINRLD